MPGQSKIQKKPIKRIQETQQRQQQFKKALEGMHARRLGGVFNSDPRDPNASQRKPLGTFDPKKGTWTPNKKRKLGS